MNPISVKTALLGVDAHERRVLVSALATLSAAALLDRTIEWTSPAEADLLIVDISNAEAVKQAEGLDHLWPRVRVLYGPRGTAAEVTRPLKVQALTRAITEAFERLDAPSETDSVRMAPTELSITHETADGDPDLPSVPHAPHRVYRGQRY